MTSRGMLKRIMLLLMLGGLYASASYAQGTPPTGAVDGVYNVKVYGALGDGVTDDYQTIALTLTMAASVGGTVYFPTGTYLVSNSLVPSANVTLLGAGRSTSFIKASANFRSSATALVWIKASAHRVQVRDLGFISYTGFKDKNTSAIQGVLMAGVQDCVVERCWFDDSFWWSVFIGYSSRNCGVINSISDGTTVSHNVEINDSSYCYVVNNQLKNSTSNGIEIYLNSPSEGVGNRLIGNLIESSGSCGIWLDGDKDTTIVGNTVRGAAVSGLYARYSEVVGASSLSQGGHAVGNTFIDCGGTTNHAVVLAAARGWVVKDNTVRGAGNCGIYVGGEANVIEGNTISESRRAGIYVSGGNGHIIANNICFNNSTIGVGGGDGIFVVSSGNSLIGNRCTDFRATKLQRYGIFLLGANNNTLTGNVTAGNRSGGINDQGTGNLKTGNI